MGIMVIMVKKHQPVIIFCSLFSNKKYLFLTVSNLPTKNDIVIYRVSALGMDTKQSGTAKDRLRLPSGKLT